MIEILAETFGTSQKFGATLTLRETDAGTFEVVRKGKAPRARTVVVFRSPTLTPAREQFQALCGLSAYYNGSPADRFAARIEAGDFVTVCTY